MRNNSERSAPAHTYNTPDIILNVSTVGMASGRLAIVAAAAAAAAHIAFGVCTTPRTPFMCEWETAPQRRRARETRTTIAAHPSCTDDKRKS